MKYHELSAVWNMYVYCKIATMCVITSLNCKAIFLVHTVGLASLKTYCLNRHIISGKLQKALIFDNFW